MSAPVGARPSVAPAATTSSVRSRDRADLREVRRRNQLRRLPVRLRDAEPAAQARTSYSAFSQGELTSCIVAFAIDARFLRTVRGPEDRDRDAAQERLASALHLCNIAPVAQLDRATDF